METTIIEAVKAYLQWIKDGKKDSASIEWVNSFKPVYNLISKIFHNLSNLEELICEVSFQGKTSEESTELTRLIHDEVVESFKRMPSIGVFVKVARELHNVQTETLSVEKE